ncbi:hypothetical protein PIB30_090105 [Stylosanthes scabra]|uniref:Ubiquitin-like protease family profile domain-containing protein n=1 Tax=Stylosanthes scabra TaxID=79078 RepID=A0ABU6QWL7_9FABA|nr:hypothetical protein [Stylosanthes scabra]
MKVLHPLVPKVEELQEDQPPRVVEQPSQTVVEVVPIYPTQEIIDVSSRSEDERKPLIPKTEEYHVSSPSARIITEVLMNMNREPQQDEAPSFDLGINPPLLTTQDLSDIEELDELVKKSQDQFQTPQTKKSLENQKDLEEKVVTWAMVPKGENEFETIFKLSGDRFLEAMRYQFQSMRPRMYIDIQVITIMCHILNNEQNEQFEKFVYCVPPKIMLFAPILFSKYWWLCVLDVEKRDFFVLDSKNIVSPSDERSTMNRFASNILDQMRIWAGAPSIFNEGSCSLLPRYVNIPGQPNETDCGVFVMKWMKLIDSTSLADCCEANKGYNIEKWGENIRSAAVLRSPYVQVSSADLYSK